MSASMTRMVRHAFRMMLGTFASRVLGLVREMLTAAFFGATRQLDAFYVAYTMWFGYGVLFSFHGLGFAMKAGKKREA